MEMVAASKMRKAQERMQLSRPYVDKIRMVIQHVLSGKLEYQHPFLMPREVKRVGFIILSTDRGLCGGLNINLFKATVQSMKQWHKNNVEIDLCTIGRKAETFFKNLGGNIKASITQLGEKPGLEDLIGVMKVMLDGFSLGNIDILYLVSNKFVNTMSQTPYIEQLLPIPSTEPASKQDALEENTHNWDYIYEPDARSLFNGLMMRYIESLIYQGVVENIACEQAARMVAMKSASDNAANLIDELQLKYNKARQSAITQELSEIVAGAAAV